MIHFIGGVPLILFFTIAQHWSLLFNTIVLWYIYVHTLAFFLALSWFCVCLIVDVSPQRGCKITPTNPISLEPTGGIIQNGVNKVTMNCSCNGSNDAVTWFSPNGSRLYDSFITSKGGSYVIQNDERISSVLVIPTFSYSVSGMYTCGVGSSFPPSLMTISDLSKYALMNNIIIVSSIWKSHMKAKGLL